MKYILLTLIMSSVVEISVSQGTFEKINSADFNRHSTDIFGQQTKISFKYLPLKTTTLDVDIGNNFFWYSVVEKQGKIYLNDLIRQNGYTVGVNKHVENLNFIKGIVYQLVDGKIKKIKVSNKLITRREQGDSTFYHFNLNEFKQYDILEILSESKTELVSNTIIVSLNEVSNLSKSKTEVVIPQFLLVTQHPVGINDKLSTKETIYESTKTLTVINYLSERFTYFSDSISQSDPKITVIIKNVRKPPLK